MLKRKPKISIRQIIQFNTIFYLSVFTVTVGLSTFSMYRLQKEKVNEKLVLVRREVQHKLETEFQFVQKNLHLMRGYFTLFRKHDPSHNTSLFGKIVAEILHDRRVQFNGYLALEREEAQKYFYRDGFVLTSHRDLSLKNSSDYIDSDKFIQKIWDGTSYQIDPNEIWYHVAKKGQQVEYTDVYFDATYMKQWMVSGSLGIYSPKGQFQGMVGIDVLLDELALEVENIRLGDSGGAILVDVRTNRILTRLTGGRSEFVKVNDRYETPQFNDEQLKKWNRLLWDGGDIQFFDGENGKSYIVSVATLQSVPWAVICFQEYNEAYKAVFWRIGLIVIVAAFGFLVLVTVSYRFRTQVSSPLEKLIQSLGENLKYARRDEIMKVEVPAASYWEVQRVSRLVNALIRIVNHRTRRHIQTLEEQKSKALHSARMASVGQMAGNVAHEINSPLAAISLHTEVLASELERKGTLDAVTANRIRVVRQMTERIAKIVKGFLAISRDGAADPLLKFRLAEIIQETLAVSQSRLNMHGVGLQVAQVPDVIIKCRAVQISQVLLNLLNNAHDAIQKLDEKWIRIDFSENNDRLSIIVTDSGRGIPKELSEKIMEPFFTTKDVNKGTGLGLSISKSIIESHGGRFYYNSESPNTQFVIELPTV